ncbi:MAG TPA: hypothetical protein VEB22_08280 [Phycisphaerales bacterium]|nr:hypothetical protein [Phycisphaerales bacterium]
MFSRRTNLLPVAFCAAGLLVLCGAAGCARSMITGGLDTAYNSQDITRDVAFWHRLPERSAITNDEGLHGVLGFVYGEDPAKTYDERVKLAVEKGLLPRGFDEPLNATMTRGTLAYALARYLDVKGGVMMTLSGGSARYATRELTYMGLLPEDSTANQSISGLDFVGVISKVQDFVAVRGTGFEPLQKDH